jgi:hypothetical protein
MGIFLLATGLSDLIPDDNAAANSGVPYLFTLLFTVSDFLGPGLVPLSAVGSLSPSGSAQPKFQRSA